MNEKLIAELKDSDLVDETEKYRLCVRAADALEAAYAKMHEQDLRIADLVAHLNAEQAKVARLVAENERRYMDCRNELCMKCGQYRTAHLGSCGDCRWRKE